MNNLQIFTSAQFGEIRTLELDGDVWFVGSDVATALGYSKPRNAIAMHVDAKDALKQGILSSGGEQQTTLINESGLYSLILGSKLPSARQFKRWVTSEILPSIRKTGEYQEKRELTSAERKLSTLFAENAKSKLGLADGYYEQLKHNGEDVFTVEGYEYLSGIRAGRIIEALAQIGDVDKDFKRIFGNELYDFRMENKALKLPDTSLLLITLEGGRKLTKHFNEINTRYGRNALYLLQPTEDTGS